jgi:hypothetical protein
MYALPPCPPVVYRIDAKPNSTSQPEELTTELHFEKLPDISILNDIQATQVSYAVTGAIVPGRTYDKPVLPSDQELIAAANRSLQRWFRNYQRNQ